jgi:hypothetical protein
MIHGCVCTSLSGRPVEIEIADQATHQAIPCRIHLWDAQDKPVDAAGLPFWNDHFVCKGQARLELAPGDYHYEIERGPEYEIQRGALVVPDAPGAVSLRRTLKRLVHLAGEGWWAGETHIHRLPEEMPLLMQAEDLHIGCCVTWWNDGNAWAGAPLPLEPVVRFDGNRFFDQLSGEDERGGGALLFFGTSRPMPISGSQREFPPAMKYLLMAKEHPGMWVDVEKAFWWDMPTWVASGKVDSIGIAHNHMQRRGVLDGEAWGKPRDPARYPGVQGNGFWTQDIYYQPLNAGIRIPPSAGSASGVLPNPVGYNRVYAQVAGDLTWEKWWQSVRQGRVFVSNGPLLRVQANGEWPGGVFRIPEQGLLEIQLTGRLSSRDPIKAIEVILNGRVQQRLPASACRSGELLTTLAFKESGWFLVRAIADVPETFRFASTGPFYVEHAGEAARVSRQAAQFFLDWVRERMDGLKLEDPKQQDEVLAAHRTAEQFWERSVKEATCD